MTREEAIARIKDHIIVHKMHEPRAVYISEALEMALQALEKANIYDDGEHYVTISKALYDRLNVDTYTDAVSREDAIVQISWDFPNLELLKIKESLDKLPSVTPICEEREKGECPWYAG